MCAQRRQISLGIHPAWSESSPCTHWVAKGPRFLHADSKDWSDWADAQADLSLCWAHRSFCWFCQTAAQIHIEVDLLPTKLRPVYTDQSALLTFEPHHEKTCLCHRRTTTAQISLHIHSLISTLAVLCLDSIIVIISVSEIIWAGWFVYYLVAKPWKQYFSWHGSFIPAMRAAPFYLPFLTSPFPIEPHHEKTC